MYMPVVGFSFNKINIEKKSALKGKISIKNNITVKDVAQRDLSLGKSSEGGLGFVFEFTSKYEPNFAELLLGGEVIYIDDAKKCKRNSSCMEER